MRLMYLLISLFVLISISLFAADVVSTHTLRLLMIDSQTGEPYKTVRICILKNLAKKGYVPGKNLHVKHYSIGNYKEAVANILKAEVNNKYDVVVLNGTMALKGAKKYAMGDPRHKFVFGAVTDPVGEGVIDNIDQPPKSNFTGVTYQVDVAERLRFMLKMLPNIRTIGLVYADMPQSESYNAWLDVELQKPEF